jgi:mycofactocin system glycosyltransferase
VIPLGYRLRGRVRLTEVSGAPHAVCDLPLAVLRLDRRSVRLLEMTVGGAAVHELAAGLGIDPERVVRLCEYFRSRGLLDVELERSDGRTPSVTVIVPVKDRAADLDDCLASLAQLDYPRELVEVIVVDDGSSDGSAAVAARRSCTVLVNGRTRGQSYSRNLAASQASGDLLAFTDSDCVVDPGWLRELVVPFAWPRVSAVGGGVESCFSTTLLDRYEQVASSLDMGRRLLVSLDAVDTFYVPTCNLLVRRDAYLTLGGLREGLRVGEDVDLCWRLRARGDVLLYVPGGRVRHKHRSSWPAMLRRRAEYGTSEATLSVLHPEKHKRLAAPPWPALSLATVLAVLLLRNLRLVPLALLPWTVDVARRLLNLHGEGVSVSPWLVGFSALRVHLSLAHSLLFMAVRYCLLGLVGLAAFVPRLRLPVAFAVLYTSAVDYSVKRPRMSYPSYVGCCVLEHSAYQVGVALGCLQRRTLRPYRISLVAPPGGRVRPGQSSSEASSPPSSRAT